MILAAVALTLIGVAAAGWWIKEDSHLPSGPLAYDGTPDVVGGPMPLNTTFTYGHIILYNTGAEAGVLDTVTPTDRSSGLEVVATHADNPEIDVVRGVTARAPSYPPKGETLHPVRGFPLPPNAGVKTRYKLTTVNIVFGLRVHSVGRFTFSGVDVRYHIGTHHYLLHVPQGFAACGVTDYRHTTSLCEGPIAGREYTNEGTHRMAATRSARPAGSRARRCGSAHAPR